MFWNDPTGLEGDTFEDFMNKLFDSVPWGTNKKYSSGEINEMWGIWESGGSVPWGNYGTEFTTTAGNGGYWENEMEVYWNGEAAVVQEKRTWVAVKHKQPQQPQKDIFSFPKPGEDSGLGKPHFGKLF